MERDIESLHSTKDIDALLSIVAKCVKNKTRIILAGGLAMIAYGRQDRHTYDIDAEISSKSNGLIKFDISISEIKRYAYKSIKASPPSTDLLIFKKNLKYFEKRVK